MPAVGLGTWKIPKEQVGEATYQAIRAGYRLIDEACDYGNEKECGEGLKRAIEEVRGAHFISLSSPLFWKRHDKHKAKTRQDKTKGRPDQDKRSTMDKYTERVAGTLVVQTFTFFSQLHRSPSEGHCHP
jgi:diketogulonate reductase-like aldo/keto reductase